MCEIIGADSLTFLSVEGMVEAIGRQDEGETRGHCMACFTGNIQLKFILILQQYEKETEKNNSIGAGNDSSHGRKCEVIRWQKHITSRC